MAVAPFSRLLPPPPADAPIRPALSRVRRLVPVRSSPPRLPSLLSFPPARRPRRFSAQGNGGPPEALEEAEAGEESKKQKEGGEEGEKRDGAASAAASVAEELKEMMAARRKESSSSSSDLWAGVAEEVGEIEWPPFGKVLGTTGVVLAVIAGSSVALLTVNAILAEISDKVFAGKGIQDFL